MFNVTPLFCIKSSVQVSWRPELCPCTPPHPPAPSSFQKLAESVSLPKCPNSPQTFGQCQIDHIFHTLILLKKINVYSLPRCAFIISHNMMLNLCVHCLRGRLCCGSFEGVVGCYQQDHSMDGCPN